MPNFLRTPRAVKGFLSRYAFVAMVFAVACSNAKTSDGDGKSKSDAALSLQVDGAISPDAVPKFDADAQEDAGLDDLPLDAVANPELPGLDVVANCPGGSGCPCSENSACESGLCIDDPKAPDGKACAYKCSSTCPEGYSCAAVNGGGDIQTICVPQFAHLCEPCAASKDCEGLGLKDSACVDQGGLGRFCGVACGEVGDCPADYSCADVVSAEGAKFKQCVRSPSKGSAALFGECSCSVSAVKKQLATACFADGGAGAPGAKCPGVRACGANGLSACNAPAPATETCDGADNDCDGQTDEGTCDDQLPCTKDLCDGKGSCTFTFVSGPGCDLAKGCTQVSDNGKPCEADNDLCTQGDLCANGLCKVGSAVQCDDGNPCTVDGCDKKTGQCTAAAVDDGVPCNDGTKCTEKDGCKAGVCKGKAVDCDDDNACTEDVCDPQVGCQISKLTGAPCSDDNPCTVGDLCKDGQCAAGEPKVCTSGDPCVTSQCSPVDGKSKLGSAAAGTKCDDGNACTASEACDQGVCQGGANGCGCQNDKDCAGKEDGNLCNGTLFCDKGELPYSCKVKPGSVVKCDSSGDSECSTTVCAPASGACEKVAAADGKGCDADGSVCTVGDACAVGKCLAGKGKSCDDGNVCTDDACDALLGCKAAANAKPCDDGNACSTSDSCGGGTCSGTPKNPVTDCGDGNPCTNDACDPKVGCTHAVNQAQCDDGNPCTVGDLCAVGKCSSGANSCGCQADSDCAAQEDGDLCNGTLVCDKGKLPYVCVVAAKTVVACDLSQDTTCSATVCNGKSGACGKVLAVDGKGCDADGSVCTVGDACKGGVCGAGQAADCDDKNACTQDSCDGKKGCLSTALALGSSCSDGNACTENDTCSNGACVAGKAMVCDDGKVCTADSCDGKSGVCLFNGQILTGKACEADGSVCTAGDACAGGVCVTGAKLACADDNVCTDDNCDATTGCTHVGNTEPCDADGSACTQNDACGGKVCVKGKALGCDDGQSCTVDSCDPATGKCVYVGAGADGQACDADGSACTDKDQCTGGKCVAGKALGCGDGNLCTDDGCDAVKGCTSLPILDLAKCGTSTACISGVCTGELFCKAAKDEVLSGGQSAAVSVVQRANDYLILIREYNPAFSIVKTTTDGVSFGPKKFLLAKPSYADTLVATPNGGAVVMVHEAGSTNPNLVAIALDLELNQTNVEYMSMDGLCSLKSAALFAGSIFAVGSCYKNGSDYAALIKLSQTGQFLSSIVLSNVLNSQHFSIAAIPDGFVVGGRSACGTKTCAYLRKYSSSMAVVWERQYQFSSVTSILPTPKGFLLGGPDHNWDKIRVSQASHSGETKWEEAMEGWTVVGLATEGGGVVVATNRKSPGAFGVDFSLIRLDGNGKFVGRREYPKAPAGSEEAFAFLAVDAGFVMAGRTDFDGKSTYNPRILRTDKWFNTNCSESGYCAYLTSATCNDSDACTMDWCDPKLGCTHAILSCDDGNPTTADKCDKSLGCL